MIERRSVHVLRHGVVLCGQLHGVPAGWGPGQVWIGVNDPAAAELATCPECRRVLALLSDPKRATNAYTCPGSAHNSTRAGCG